MYKILNNPVIYSLTQKLFGFGGKRLKEQMFREILAQLPPARVLVDIGCGPSSHLFQYKMNPLGVDLSQSYIRKYCTSGHSGIVASVEALPIASGSINGVWSTGLFHHVPDNIAKKGISEMVRICSPSGYVVILDAVLPESTRRKPAAAAIRYLDRGKFMRHQIDFKNILPHRERWQVKRITYNMITRIEMLVMIFPA